MAKIHLNFDQHRSEKRRCTRCNGTGRWPKHVCGKCNGSGRRFLFICSTCKGNGYIPEKKCFLCDGTGYLSSPSSLPTIPLPKSPLPQPDKISCPICGGSGTVITYGLSSPCPQCKWYLFEEWKKKNLPPPPNYPS